MPYQSDSRRRVVNAVAAGNHVMIRGYWGADQSTFVLKLTQDLERVGHHVIRVAAHSRLRSSQFAALRFAVADVFRGAPDTVTVIDRLCLAFEEEALPILVVENADQLDSFSAQALNEVVRRTGCLTVSSLSEASISEASPLQVWPLVVVGLKRPNFLTFEDVLYQKIPNLSAALVRRLYLDSGASTQLALALLETGITAGAIVNDDGMWVAARDDLTSDEIFVLISRLLSDLPDGATQCLHYVAQKGVVTVDELSAVSDRILIDGLERMGLLGRLRDDGSDHLVRVVPPVVAQYFQRGGVGSFGAGTPEEAPADIEQIASELDADARRHADALRAVWAASPSSQAWLELAQALWSTGAPISEIPPAPEWLTPDAADYASMLTAATPAIRGGARTVETLTNEFFSPIPVVAVGASPLGPLSLDEHRGEVDFEPLDPRDSLALAIEAFSRGDLSASSELMPPRDDLEGPYQSLHVVLSRLEEVAAGHIDAVYRTARSAFAESVRRRDRDRIFVDGYTAALTAAMRGEMAEALLMISNARLFGRPALELATVLRAMISLQALMLANGGRRASAVEIVRSAGEYVGYVPRAELDSFAHLIDAICDRDATAFAREMARSIAVHRAQGRELVAQGLEAILLASNPAKAADIPPGRATVDCAGLSEFFAAMRALANGRLAAAVEAISSSESAVAYLAYSTLVREAAITSGDERTQVVGLLQTLAARHSFPSPDSLSAPGGLSVLSVREIEVAFLAASLSNSEIAKRLGISRRTVDHHISNALKKSGTTTRHELHSFVASADAGSGGPDSDPYRRIA